jgi:DNA-binding transcriptional LysR family regulator
MDIDKLRALVELERLGTMAAVAQATGYGTSAVSQQLAALERQSGVRLLEATGRRVRLTPAGRRLAEHGRRILTAVTAAQTELAAQDEPHGLVRIGGFTGALRDAVLPAFARLIERYPAIELEVSEGEPEEVLTWLDDDVIDVGFIYDYSMVPRAPRHPATLLFAREMVLAVPDGVDVPDRIRTPADLDALRGWDWVGNSRDTGDDELSARLCALGGWSPTIRHRADSLALVIDLVEARRGVSMIVSDSPEIHRVRTVHIDLARVERRVWSVLRAGTAEWPATAAVLAAVDARSQENRTGFEERGPLK